MKNKFSLKNILLGSFIFTEILPILILGIVASTILIDGIREEINIENNLLAKSVKREVQRFLINSELLLNHIKDEINDKTIITGAFVSYDIDSLIKTYAFFESIFILDNNGIVIDITPYSKDFMGIDQSGHEFYKIPTAQNINFWSHVFISESTGMPTLSLSIPTDYKIIVGYINLNKLTSIIENIQIGKDGFASITDSTGTVIAHPDKNKFSQRVNISSLNPIKQALLGNPGTYIYHDNGENYIGSVSIVNPTNWIILISQSEKEAFAPVNNIQFLLIVFIIIAILVAIIMSFLSLQIALKPLSLFTKATKTIAEGNYTNIALPHSYKEINELGANYSLMAQAIHVREKELKESEERYRLLFEKMQME